jgi:cell division protein FtsL
LARLKSSRAWKSRRAGKRSLRTKTMATATVPYPNIRRSPQLASASRAGFPDVYVVKRIDNSRLSREVNPERRRQCFTLLGLGGLVFFAGLMLAWQHFQCVRLGYEIQQLKAQQSSFVELNRELRLAQASLADPQRIDQIARKKLGLAPPAPQQVVRLGASEAPGGAMVDARMQSAEPSRGQ